MRKRVMSLLLALVMVCSLLPMASFAADADTAPVGDEDVAVLVYGKLISDLVNKDIDLETLVNIVKNAAQDALAGAKIPDVDMVLVSDAGYEYPLVKGGVEGASFSTSFSFEADGMLSLGADVFKFVQDAFGKALDGLITASGMKDGIDRFNQLFKVYGASNVPAGHYVLKVRHINADGYTLIQPASGSVEVNVVAGRTNYVGYTKNLYTLDFKAKLYEFADQFPSVTVPILGELSARRALNDIFNGADGALATFKKYFGTLMDGLLPGWDLMLSLPVIRVGMPGVFLTTVDPGFSFTSADFGGNPLPGTSFVMVNREETEKIVKASIALGQSTFQNAMAKIGTEGFTWDELNILKADIVSMDTEAKQISFNPEQAFKLVATYWALFEASVSEPLSTFMSTETDLRLPAILKATADENGIVTFTEDSNITLTWSIEVLMKMAGLANDVLQDLEVPAGLFENETLDALVQLMVKVAKIASEEGNALIDASGNIVTEVVNDWLYPLLMNDDIAGAFKSTLAIFGIEDEGDSVLLALLPTHAILTAKMPAGHYILMESAVPEGYVRSPMFYTVVVTWNTESEDLRDWCYVNVANLGIIAPYFAEELYNTVRGTSLLAQADKFLNQFTGGQTGTLLQNIFTGKVVATGDDFDLTALTIAYQAKLIYNNMGGSQVYESEDALIEALNSYLYSHGRTAQNLMMFGYEVSQKAKAVFTSEITPESFTFYTSSTSLRTNVALKAQAIGRKIAQSIDTSNGSKTLTAAQDTISKVAESIDTSNHIQPILNQVTQTVKTAVTNVVTQTIKNTTSMLKNMFSMFTKK